MPGPAATERLFLALRPERQARERIARAARDALAPILRELKVVPAERLHLTLLFLGAVAPAGRARLEQQLAAHLTGARAPDLTVRATGQFPGRGPARVLWAGLAERLPARLAALAEGARSAARAAGLEFDAKPFRAHLTLARVRRGRAVPLPEAFASLELEERWRPDAVLLVRSQPGPDGPVYEDVGRFALEAAGPDGLRFG